MNNLTITDVRSLPGDSAFLLDDGVTAVLYDSGFAFTGYQVADNIAKVLGDRPLDYIFLTHSHYDHVLGVPYIRARYPGAVVVAGEYAHKIFSKPTARTHMREMDRKYARRCGIGAYEDRVDELRVDMAVKEGDVIHAGAMDFTVMELPGHTKCSVGFYLGSEKLLLGSETLGVYDGEETVVPSYLVGYEMTRNSIAKVEGVAVEQILLPHYGVLDREKTAFYLSQCRAGAEKIAAEIASILRNGGTREEAVQHFRRTFYRGGIPDIYPEDAMLLNTNIMVDLIERELLCGQPGAAPYSVERV